MFIASAAYTSVYASANDKKTIQRKKKAPKLASPFDQIKIARVVPFLRHRNRPESQASFERQSNERGRTRSLALEYSE